MQAYIADSLVGAFLQWKRRLRELQTCQHVHLTPSICHKCPCFCVFKYARAVKQKVRNEAENRERDWGETLKYALTRFTGVWGSRASRA